MKRSDLGARLMQETAGAHRSLEAAVNFELARPSAAVARRMLLSFHGVLFWLEPRLARLLPSDLLAGRVKLPLLLAGLSVLGQSPPRDPPKPQWLPADREQAMGALYVLEGSTLGGKLINRALRQLPEWPASGSTYFDPYGGRTGAMWAGFQAALAELPQQSGDAVVEGAERTFVLLETHCRAEVV